MSTTAIPQALKQADITRFANRASQLKSFKPVISYWCNYHILEQILAKKLHTQDEECLQYTTSLMDELETFKAQNTQNDTVTDDVASQAYVEQFAYETFQRAENAMRANKASLQTADTLQAAATFFELLQIWGKLDPEISKKIKFAKYHALRIAKALKTGEDPNLTNPKFEDTSEGDPLNSEDPDVQAITQEQTSKSAHADQATGEDMSGEKSRGDDESAMGKLPNKGSDESEDDRQESGLPVRLPGVIDLDAPPQAPLRKSSAGIIPDLPAAPSDFNSPASSRVESPKTTATNPQDEDGKKNLHAGVMPEANPMTPPPTSLTPPNVPSASADKGVKSRVQPHNSHRPSPLAQPPIESSSTPLSPGAAPVDPAVPVSSVPRPSISAVSGIPGPATRAAAPPSTSPTHSPIPPPTLPSGPAETLDVDDHNITEAQKHARWAVSALQFDDVPTAIKELRIALGHLGTQ